MHIKKMECSKKILLIAALAFAAVILFTFVMVWRTCDLSPLAYLIPSLGGVVATGVGFYYWKARAENQIKLKKIYGESLATDDVFTETSNY